MKNLNDWIKSEIVLLLNMFISDSETKFISSLTLRLLINPYHKAKDRNIRFCKVINRYSFSICYRITEVNVIRFLLPLSIIFGVTVVVIPFEAFFIIKQAQVCIVILNVSVTLDICILKIKIKTMPKTYNTGKIIYRIWRCLFPCELGRILVFEICVEQKNVCKKLCLRTYCELDLLIFLFFLFKYDAVIIKLLFGYSFGKKVVKFLEILRSKKSPLSSLPHEFGKMFVVLGD